MGEAIIAKSSFDIVKWLRQTDKPLNATGLWHVDNGLKAKAHRKANLAISRGIIEEINNCSKCGSGDWVVKHHEDYNKPLDITWLCKNCHAKRHAEMAADLTNK